MYMLVIRMCNFSKYFKFNTKGQWQSCCYRSITPETTSSTFTHFDTKPQMHTIKISWEQLFFSWNQLIYEKGIKHIRFERLQQLTGWLVLRREQQQCKSQRGNPKCVHRSCCIVGRLQTNLHLYFHCVLCTLSMLLQLLRLWSDPSLPFYNINQNLINNIKNKD